MLTHGLPDLVAGQQDRTHQVRRRGVPASRLRQNSADGGEQFVVSSAAGQGDRSGFVCHTRSIMRPFLALASVFLVFFGNPLTSCPAGVQVCVWLHGTKKLSISSVSAGRMRPRSPIWPGGRAGRSTMAFAAATCPWPTRDVVWPGLLASTPPGSSMTRLTCATIRRCSVWFSRLNQLWRRFASCLTGCQLPQNQIRQPLRLAAAQYQNLFADKHADAPAVNDYHGPP